MVAISPTQLKAKLVQAARELGFDLVGVTRPDPPPHMNVFRQWIESGRHGQMEYLARPRNLERRADPRRIMPKCQSILVLGMNYLPEQSAGAGAADSARIASYAHGVDYHDLIPARLEQLMEQLEGWVGGPVAHRLYTDTGPVLERDLAQRAGLGWIGKNTCLINPQLGSYYFLAEILLAVELPPDSPFDSDHCGSCTRCLDACPTNCILEDRTLDARRCISYLTIELKEEIPVKLRDALEGWLFGCDICQQVCPWNIRFAQPSAEAGFQTRPELTELEPGRLLTMTEEIFRDEFRGSPLKRAKRRGMARNAAAVLGGRADASAIGDLSQALLHDSEALVRAHAAWALGRIGSSNALQVLRQALATEASEEVIAEIGAALAQK
jgi:epoxyqueuosine reductase